MNELIIKAPENVERQIRSEIGPMYTQAVTICQDAYKLEVTDEDDKDGQTSARVSRMTLRRLRIDAVNKCKELKADALATGKAIDETRRKIEDLFKPAEDHLLMQETFAERMAAERAKARQAERESAITQVGGNPLDYRGFADMADSQFSALIEGIKHEVARRKAQEEEDRKRIQEQEEKDKLERNRLAEENARLKAEAEQREAEAAKERSKARMEQMQRDAELRAERAKIQEIEAAKRKADADAKAKAEAEAQAERDKLNAPIKEKLEELIKHNADFEDITSQLSVAHQRTLSEAIRSWNYEIGQIIKRLP